MPLRLPSPRKAVPSVQVNQTEAVPCNPSSGKPDPGIRVDKENNINSGSSIGGLQRASSVLSTDASLPATASIAAASAAAPEVGLSSRTSVKLGFAVGGIPISKGLSSRQRIGESSAKISAIALDNPSGLGTIMPATEKKGFMKSDNRGQNRTTDALNNNGREPVDNFVVPYDENKNAKRSDTSGRDRPSSARTVCGAVSLTANANFREPSLMGLRNIPSCSDTELTPASPVQSLRSSKLTPPSSAKARNVASARQGRCQGENVSRSVPAGGRSLSASAHHGNSSPAKSVSSLEQMRHAAQRRGNSTDPSLSGQTQSRGNILECVNPSSVEHLVTKLPQGSKPYGLRPPKVTATASLDRPNDNGGRIQPNSGIPNLVACRPPSAKASSGTNSTDSFDTCNNWQTRVGYSSASEKVLHGQASGFQSRRYASKLNAGDGYQSETAAMSSQDTDCASVCSVPSGMSSSTKSKLRPTNLHVKSPTSPPPVPVRSQSLNAECASTNSSVAAKNSKQAGSSAVFTKDANKNKKLPKKEVDHEDVKYPLCEKHSLGASGCASGSENLRTAAIAGGRLGNAASANHLGFPVAMLSPRYAPGATDRHYDNLPRVAEASRQDRSNGMVTDTGIYANSGQTTSNSGHNMISQTPKLQSRSKMVAPSVYTQGVNRSLAKNSQPTCNGMKENWQKYCIPNSNSAQLVETGGNVERATLPKIGKMTREAGFVGLLHQMSDSGRGQAQKVNPGELSCTDRSTTQPGAHEKLFRKDCRTNNEFTHQCVNASKLETQICSPLSSGLKTFSDNKSGVDCCGQSILSFGHSGEKPEASQLSDRRLVQSKTQFSFPETAGSIGRVPGLTTAAGLLYSHETTSVKPKHFGDRNPYEFTSCSERKASVSSYNSYSLDSASKVVNNSHYPPQSVTHCYQNPYSMSRSSTPRHSTHGLMPASVIEDEFESGCMPCTGKESNQNSGLILQTGSKASSSSVRPSSPRLLASRDEDVHGSMLSLISNVSSVYSVAEDKQTQEIYKLKRELEMAYEKINTLTTQLSTNSHVVAAFEQSLSNMTRRLQKLMTSSELKDAELSELRATMHNLQPQGGSHQYGPEFLRRQSSTLLASPGSDRGDGSTVHPADIMSSLTSLSSAVNVLSEATASLDKKNKKKSWLKNSITKAFSRKKTKSWTDNENNPVIIQLDLSAQNSPFATGAQRSGSIDSGQPVASSVQNVVQVGDCAGTVGLESVVKLQQQLHEKDLKLTDIQLEALSSAHQLEQLKETMNRMKTQIAALKCENERMQKIMEFKGQEPKDLSSNESAQNCKLNLGGLTNFDSIAMDTTNKDGGRFSIAVEMGGTADSSLKTEVSSSRVFIGSVEVTNHTNWEMLDSSIRQVLKEYLTRLEPGTSMGLSGSSILHYRIGEIRRSKGHDLPELLPCGYLVGENTTINLKLRGSNENSIDSLVFETLVPKSILQRYVSLIMEHRRMILCGPSGTGKTYLAQKLAEYLIKVSRKPNSNAIAVFNVDHKSSKELRQYLSNIADQCENAASDLPSVIILDNLQHVGSLGEAFNAFLGVDVQLCPYIIGTMTQTGSTVGSLQLHHNFRWVLCPNHLEPVRGFLSRFLQRRLIEEEVISGMKNPELTRISSWLPKVWQQLNKFLETYSSSDVTIGPRLFLTCPMDTVTSQTWFADLWNYSIIPYLLEAVREGVQAFGHKAKWEDPTEWVIHSCPWTEKMQKREWPSLLHLRPEDVGYDAHSTSAPASAAAAASRTSQNDTSSSDGPDPLLTLVMRLQEAAGLSATTNDGNSDSESFGSHDSELDSHNSTAEGQELTTSGTRTDSEHGDHVESTI